MNVGYSFTQHTCDFHSHWYIVSTNAHRLWCPHRHAPNWYQIHASRVFFLTKHVGPSLSRARHSPSHLISQTYLLVIIHGKLSHALTFLRICRDSGAEFFKSQLCRFLIWYIEMRADFWEFLPCAAIAEAAAGSFASINALKTCTERTCQCTVTYVRLEVQEKYFPLVP